MESINRWMWARGAPGLGAVVMFAAATPGLAAATTLSTMTLQNASNMVTSSSTVAFTGDYVLPTAGTLTVTVSDQLFPSALTQLDFTLLNGSSVVGSPLSGLNTNGSTSAQLYSWDFNLQAGNYSTLFAVAATNAGIPGAPSFGVGLFTDTITFTPSAPAVPLPSAGGVLLVGTGALGLMSRRRRIRMIPSELKAFASRFALRGNALHTALIGIALVALEYCI